MTTWKSSTRQPTTFELGFRISREMWEDQGMNTMKRMTEKLRDSFTRRAAYITDGDQWFIKAPRKSTWDRLCDDE